tara:strand:- start:81 stop:419 length:339 start_codon:yes stop_codon:yes gene_type:complete
MSCSDIPEYDINIYQGDDKTIKFRYSADGVAVDLTGYTITLECAAITLNKTALIAPDQVLNAGEYEFTYIPADTIGLESVRPKYEVVFWPTGLAGTKSTKYKGTIYIEQEVV